MQAGLTAATIIETLGLARHPEGGWYAETFRDISGGGTRAVSTAIYFLLEAGDLSKWHRVTDAAEVWHHHAGAPLELKIWGKGEKIKTLHLGSDLAAGERPQAVVPANQWQSARSLGAWSLMGCTVAPGFEFSAFELAPDGWEPPAGPLPA